jgi:hypothetical protein
MSENLSAILIAGQEYNCELTSNSMSLNDARHKIAKNLSATQHFTCHLGKISLP